MIIFVLLFKMIQPSLGSEPLKYEIFCHASQDFGYSCPISTSKVFDAFSWKWWKEGVIVRVSTSFRNSKDIPSIDGLVIEDTVKEVGANVLYGFGGQRVRKRAKVYLDYLSSKDDFVGVECSIISSPEERKNYKVKTQPCSEELQY
jgi:hypothetical protein